MSSSFDKPFFKMPLTEALPWLDASGPAADMVLSTRGRLVRNLSEYEFPNQASASTLQKISAEILPVLGADDDFKGPYSFDLAALSAGELAVLKEMHLLSSGSDTPTPHGHLFISNSCTAAALVNGDDHLRLYGYRSGFQVQSVLSDLEQIEERLEKQLNFAFEDDFGFLTASPTNAGTGLRLSVMIHLPGLVLGGEIDKILNALRQLRFGVRGLFGSGNAVRGGIFLISNLVTMGRDESEIASDFKFHLGKVIIHERTARQQLFANDSLGLEDLAHRSLAVLQNARLMTAQEAADRFNHLRVGVGFGMMPGIDFALLNRAMIQYQSAHLEAQAGHALATAEKTEARATLLRKLFSEF